MEQLPRKIYTDILENENKISKTEIKKRYFENFSSISLSTYNKYLRELKEGTYSCCERENNEFI